MPLTHVMSATSPELPPLYPPSTSFFFPSPFGHMSLLRVNLWNVKISLELGSMHIFEGKNSGERWGNGLPTFVGPLKHLVVKFTWLEWE